MPEQAAGRRPSRRKEQVAAAAARRMERVGYLDANLADIGADLGLTGPALYRHFRSKQELLVAGVEREVEDLERSYRRPESGLTVLLDDAASTALGPERASALWERNNEFLEAADRARLGERYDAAVANLASAVAAAHPALDEGRLRIVTWATHGIFSLSRAFEPARADPERARTLMVDAAASVVASVSALGLTPDDDADGSYTRLPAGGLLPVSRREAVLGAAMALFTDRGFQDVSMEDIGSAAGITGPTLYHYFGGKSAILTALVLRWLEAMHLELAGVLASTADPARALRRLVAGFARMIRMHGDVPGRLLAEVTHVGRDERDAVRRAQLDYIGEWVALLLRVRPELAPAEALALVRSAQSVLYMVRSHVHDDETDPGGLMIALGRAVLGIDRAPGAAQNA